jgi:hypothetical protein
LESRAKCLLLVALVPLALVLPGCAAGFRLGTFSQPGGWENSRTLEGYVGSSFGGDTTYFWRYGKDRNYTDTTPQRTIRLSDNGHGYEYVFHELDGLTAGTTYHFQLCAWDLEESPARTNCSEDQTFATQPVGGTWRTFCTGFLGGAFSTFVYGDPPGFTGLSCTFNGSRGPNPDPGNLLLLSCPTSVQNTNATRVLCFANLPVPAPGLSE